MNENTLSTQVQDYLKGRLSSPEKAAFEQKLAEDPALQQELALQRLEMEATESLIAAETRQLFENWKQEAPNLAPKRFNFTAGHAGIVLLSLVLLYGVYRWMQAPLPPPPPPIVQPERVPAPVAEQNNPVSPKPEMAKPAALNPYPALAKAHFKEPVLSSFRSGKDNSAGSRWQDAKTAYEKRNYDRVLSLLVDMDSTRRQSADFLTGCALFHLNRYEEASNKFLLVLSAGNQQFKWQSEWSLLLCRLAQYPKFEKDARQRLDAILANPNHPYHEQATQLKKSIKKE